jgi:phage I-like protein
MKNRTGYGYWVDVTGIKFEENGTSQWIHAMPLGDWKHPVHGVISFTLDRLQRFAANVNAKVRGQDLDIDYDHKALRTDAAGWVQKAETRGDGLWLLIDWTSEAAQSIKDKAFRYFSPEFQDVWEHPQTGRKIKDVLFGGGITNRPFLKDMIPLNLHELCTDDSTGGGMNRALLETIAKGYKIQFSDDTSDADLQTAVTSAAAVAAASADDDSGDGDENNDGNDGNDGNDDENTSDDASDGDVDTQLSEAAKKNPLLAAVLQQNTALQTQNKQLGERIGHLETANRIAETSTKLSELREGKRQLSPASEKKLSEVAAGLPAAQASKLFEAAKTILGDGGIVELGEKGRQGGSGSGDDGGESYEDAAEFDKAVNKQLTEAKAKGEEIDYLEATLRASTDNPELYEAYRKSSRFATGS